MTIGGNMLWQQGREELSLVSGSDLKQRLAAILAADAAGYSRLMAADERATVDALDTARGVFRSQIDSHQGRVIDMAGDSVLAVFETANGAVSAALAIQEQLKARVADVSANLRMQFRIGVHLGDVMEKADGTVYGDGVNIAARLEGLAEPGGITVSGAVEGAVRGKLSAGFIDLGEHRLKNIPEPVNVFRVGITGKERPPARSIAQRKMQYGISVVAALGIGVGIYYVWRPLEDERTRLIPTPDWKVPGKERPIMLAERQSATKMSVEAKTETAAATPVPKPEASVQAVSGSERERPADENAARKALERVGKAPPSQQQTQVASAAPAAAAAAPSRSSPERSLAANNNSESDALYQQALAMENSGDAKGAIRIYRRAARAGSGKAALRLGDIFDRGVAGVPRDYAESLQWFETARQLGEQVETAGRR